VSNIRHTTCSRTGYRSQLPSWVANQPSYGWAQPPRWRAGDGSKSEVTLVSECHSGQVGRHGPTWWLVTLCVSPPRCTFGNTPFVTRNTHLPRTLPGERYCVKLLVGVGRRDAVAAWPSHDCTPLKEPFERLVRDHRRPDTLKVLPNGVRHQGPTAI